MSGVAELADPRASRGPSTSQLVRPIAMKFSISVVTTSSTPSRARKRPGANNHAPPTKEAAARAKGMSSRLGQDGRLYPATAATMPPR